MTWQSYMVQPYEANPKDWFDPPPGAVQAPKEGENVPGKDEVKKDGEVKLPADAAKQPGDGKNAMMALLSVADVKHVVVTDDDIDVFDPTDVEWAIATRVQADRDVLIVPNARSKPLDPSLPPPLSGKIPTTAKMGIDATIPENVPRSRYNRIIYFNQGKVDLKDYLGAVSKSAMEADQTARGEISETSKKILAALENSHYFFADLLALFPTINYRAFASAIGRLQEERKIVQDGDGKYQRNLEPH